MKHITILIPDDLVNMGTIATIVGTVEMFAEANAYWERSGNKARYRIQTAGVSKKVTDSKKLIIVQPELNIAEIKKTDLIVVPPSSIRNNRDVKNGNKTIVSWIAKQYKMGAEVASMCSGVFMLAASGILDGKTCSTHWAHAQTFRDAFPGIDMKDEKLITDESGIYTNGGAYSFLNLVIFLIEKYYDKQTAIYCTKIFQVALDRNTQIRVCHIFRPEETR